MRELNISDYHFRAPGVNLRLALLTDLHDCGADEIVRAVRSLSPDAVLIAGDLFESPPRRRCWRMANAQCLLRQLAADYPIFYSPGNHDLCPPDKFLQTLRETGVEYLCDRAVSFRGVVIGGLSSAAYRKPRVPALPFLQSFADTPGYKILLCHHPEYYPRFIRPLPIDMTLSGHAHGGQWSIFGHGMYAPGQGLFPRYTAGVYENRLLVSRGLKRSALPRFGNPREICLITLSDH